MEFGWDEAKSEACLRERGFDFTYVLRAFLNAARLIRRDLRWEYGEERFQMLGRVQARVFFVTYTVRGERIRIISARKANRREIQRYEDSSSDA